MWISGVQGIGAWGFWGLGLHNNNNNNNSKYKTTRRVQSISSSGNNEIIFQNCWPPAVFRSIIGGNAVMLGGQGKQATIMGFEVMGRAFRHSGAFTV